MSLASAKWSLTEAALAALVDWPVERENFAFDIPEAAKWARLTIKDASAKAATMGSGGEDKAIGFIQVDLFYPRGSGDLEARADVNALRDAFPYGQSFTYEGQTVTMQECEDTVVPDDQFYHVAVRATFYAFVKRRAVA